MPWLEPTCLAIIALYLIVVLPREQHKAVVLRRLMLLSLGGIFAENSCMRLYDFYQYKNVWSIFVDKLPLLVALIWPIVIHSAWKLASRILGEQHIRVPLLLGAFVLADASLIEPIAVRSGLWNWNEPGFLTVPPIGILGWAFFAWASVYWFWRCDRRAETEHRTASWLEDVLVLPVALLFTHALLLAGWWGFFRWVNVELPVLPVLICAWLVLCGAAVVAWRRNLRSRVPFSEITVRIPAALFFFVLLALHHEGSQPLVAYAFAFVPPYMALIPWRRGA
jgi:hypothetical protein